MTMEWWHWRVGMEEKGCVERKSWRGGGRRSVQVARAGFCLELIDYLLVAIFFCNESHRQVVAND
jgi:hypothetical protein